MTSTVDEAAPGSAGIDVARSQARRGSFETTRFAALLRDHWPVLALGGVAVILALLGRHLIYPAYSYNRDEPVYLWMADHLRAGVLTPTDGGAPQFFHPWLAAARNGAFFSHFTIGWPAMLVASKVVFGSPDAAPAFGAFLAVVGTYALARELISDRSLAVVAAALMAVSPIIPVQGGAYLGYLFTTGLGLLFATCLISGLRRRRPTTIVLAGVLLGFIFLTRPFDAALWSAAVGGYLLFVQRGRWRSLFTAGAWLLPGVLPSVIVALLFNKGVTGSFLALPNSAADPLDKFGFGLRRMMPAFDQAMYGKQLALRSTLIDGFRLPLFLVGSYLGLLVAWVGLFIRRRERTTLLLLAIIVVFPVTYLFHWGSWVSSLVASWGGPIYFVPLYAPLCILMATAILAAWKRRRGTGIVLVVALVIATVPAAVSRIDANHRLSVGQQPWKGSTAAIKGRALVFVADSSAYLMFYNPFAANDPKLEGRLLYATDRGAANIDLINRLHDRTPYIQRASLPHDALSVPLDNPARFPPGELQPTEHPPTPVVTVTRIRIVKGAALTLRLRVRNPAGQRTVSAYIDQSDSRTRRWRTLTEHGATTGVTETTWTVGAGDPGPDDEPEWAVRLHGLSGTLVVGAAYGSTPESARRPVVRQRFSYRVEGSFIELLTPSRPEVARTTKTGRRLWFYDSRALAGDTDAPSKLDVTVRPITAGANRHQ